MDERIKRIAKHYGYEKQKMQLMEEMGELMQAVSKYERAEYGLEIYNAFWNLVDELVDVQVMIDQMRELLGVGSECFEGKYNAKLNRQIRRIEDEKLVYVIDAVHSVGGKEYTWRVPENKKVPEVGSIVCVNAKGQVQPVIVQRIRRIPKKYAKKLKSMVGETIEQQE
jgi:NTP pyrophosphatase (non-canonical NTP hydrolase)